MTENSQTQRLIFDFPLEQTKLSINLTADVEVHHSTIYYIVSNFRTKDSKTVILPPIEIRKVKGIWVHIDSEKETALSRAAGEAIDKMGL